MVVSICILLLFMANTSFIILFFRNLDSSCDVKPDISNIQASIRVSTFL